MWRTMASLKIDYHLQMRGQEPRDCCPQDLYPPPVRPLPSLHRGHRGRPGGRQGGQEGGAQVQDGIE